jgi:hypothetical protein
MRISRKLINIAAAGIAGLVFSKAAGAESLPTEFLGNWEFLPLPEGNSDYARLQCNDREGVIITSKKITWTTEGGCDINAVKRSHRGGVTNEDNIAVSLICYQEEGRGRPLLVKTLEVWSLFNMNGERLMAQTSIKDSHTSLLQKCK